MAVGRLCQTIAAESVAALQRAVVELPLSSGRSLKTNRGAAGDDFRRVVNVVARNEAILKLLQVGKALGKQSRQQSSENQGNSKSLRETSV